MRIVCHKAEYMRKHGKTGGGSAEICLVSVSVLYGSNALTPPPRDVLILICATEGLMTIFSSRRKPRFALGESVRLAPPFAEAITVMSVLYHDLFQASEYSRESKTDTSLSVSVIRSAVSSLKLRSMNLRIRLECS